jgi:hypothetical protein
MVHMHNCASECEEGRRVLTRSLKQVYNVVSLTVSHDEHLSTTLVSFGYHWITSV